MNEIIVMVVLLLFYSVGYLQHPHSTGMISPLSKFFQIYRVKDPMEDHFHRYRLFLVNIVIVSGQLKLI
jgi:hypothetical protein